MTKERKLLKKQPSICKINLSIFNWIICIGQSIELDAINVKKTFVQVVKNILIILVRHASNSKSLRILESVGSVVKRLIQMPHSKVENQHSKMFVQNKSV